MKKKNKNKRFNKFKKNKFNYWMVADTFSN